MTPLPDMTRKNTLGESRQVHGRLIQGGYAHLCKHHQVHRHKPRQGFLTECEIQQFRAEQQQ
jgi:hypothetical protein